MGRTRTQFAKEKRSCELSLQTAMIPGSKMSSEKKGPSVIPLMDFEACAWTSRSHPSTKWT